MKTQISSTVLLLLSGANASASADDSYPATLAGCKDFAKTFDNTCSNAGVGPSVALSSVTTATQNCTGKNVGICVGQTTDTNASACSWDR
jgi:hypothetical protein